MATLFNNVGVFLSKYFGGLQENTSSAVQSAVRTKPSRYELLKNLVLFLKNKIYFVLAAIAIAIFSAAIHGNWMIILVHFWKTSGPSTGPPTGEQDTSWFWRTFPYVHWFILANLLVSYITYFSLAGFLQWHFYVKQKDKPEEWKCQPDRWLSPEDEKHEIVLGSLNMVQGSILSGFIVSYIMAGGQTMMYFDAVERGWVYLLLSIPLCFLWMDAGAYYFHRLFHEKYIYKYIHKWHHRYKAPTAFSATALHPVEFFVFQCVLASPIALIPVYSGVFIPLLLYNYYYGMVDHSGIKMDAVWPWQPDTMFHDDHHKYFHVNFGFNLKLWDWMHDTLRAENRHYTEEIFGGRGVEIKKK